MRSVPARLAGGLAGFLGAALAGLVTGAAAVLTHTSWWWLALATAAALTTLGWLRGGLRVAFAAGWCVAVARASLTRPEGDYLVSANAPGWTLLALTLVLLVGALLSAALGARRARDLGVRGRSS